MKHFLSTETIEALSAISKGRHRTNLLKNQEQRLLAFIVRHVPSCINSDMLTAIGFLGSLITVLSFILAACIHRDWLLLGVLGFAINWFGDSLDGRVAYYRNKPRKWYGFALDISVDWVTTLLIGVGFVIYVQGPWEYLGFGFVVMYGSEMITALLKYKITDKYIIDNGLFGPTEVRILISLILVLEVFFKDSIIYSGALACVLLFISNIVDMKKLLQMADKRDIKEKAEKAEEEK